MDMPVAGAPARSGIRLEFGDERRWLGVLTLLTAIEAGWWAVCWRAGIAPLPFLGTYILLAGAGLAVALALRKMIFRTPVASLSACACGALLVALGASLFLPLKYAIPAEIPMWLDRPLAAAEVNLFGVHPWLAVDRLLGWLLVPVDRVYALWLPVQTLALFLVMTGAPSREKTKALIAYGLGWFALGVVAATLLSSAGPIFYDRLLGGDTFAALAARLRDGGAWVVRAESDAMWRSLATGKPGLAAGMSAMPSLHVAISFWIYLAARGLAPRAAPFALAYTLFMWTASVQLGWHYVSDGAVGIAGMALLWWVAGFLPPSARRNVVSGG